MTSGFTDDADDREINDDAAGDGGAADGGVVEDMAVEDMADGDVVDRDGADDAVRAADVVDDNEPAIHGGAGDGDIDGDIDGGIEGGIDRDGADIEDVDGPGVRASLEAILLVADEPVPEVLLAQVLERPRGEIDAALRALAAEYTAAGRGFDLREIAGGWRFYTREDCAPLVERFVRDGQEVRLTQAALETLAVIAYRQPVSRARVSAVRGVNCDGVIRTLVLRGLVEDSGTDQETGAILYRTTGYFLERLGMASLDDLPDLAPFLPENIEDIEDNERTRA